MSVTINGDGTITSTDGTVDFGDDNLATTGTIPAAQLTGTMPAVSGAAITALNATNLATGTVATARLGTGTASSSTFLRGDGSWAAAGGGAWEVIGSVEASNDSTVQVTGLSTTHSIYALGISNMRCSASGNLYHINFGTSSGIDTGSNYRSFLEFCSVGGTYHMACRS